MILQVGYEIPRYLVAFQTSISIEHGLLAISSRQFIATGFHRRERSPQKDFFVRESGPQNGRNIQVKDV